MFRGHGRSFWNIENLWGVSNIFWEFSRIFGDHPRSLGIIGDLQGLYEIFGDHRISFGVVGDLWVSLQIFSDHRRSLGFFGDLLGTLLELVRCALSDAIGRVCCSVSRDMVHVEKPVVQ